jgi:hypothetical protein
MLNTDSAMVTTRVAMVARTGVALVGETLAKYSWNGMPLSRANDLKDVSRLTRMRALETIAYHSCLLPVVKAFVRQKTKSRPSRHVNTAVANVFPVVRNKISTTGTPVGVSRMAWTSGPRTYIATCCRSLAPSVTAIVALVMSYHDCDEADDVAGQCCSYHRPRYRRVRQIMYHPSADCGDKPWYNSCGIHRLLCQVSLCVRSH